MFIKKSWRINQNGRKSISYQIVESYRKRGKKYATHKVLATITSLPGPLIEKIGILLKSPTAKVIPEIKDFFKNSFVFGPIVFLYFFMKKIKIIEGLKIIPVKSRILLLGMILNRILEPRSKLGSVSWVKKTSFPVLFGIDKNKLVVNQVYKAMDILYKKMDSVLDSFFHSPL